MRIYHVFQMTGKVEQGSEEANVFVSNGVFVRCCIHKHIPDLAAFSVLNGPASGLDTCGMCNSAGNQPPDALAMHLLPQLCYSMAEHAKSYAFELHCTTKAGAILQYFIWICTS